MWKSMELFHMILFLLINCYICRGRLSRPKQSLTLNFTFYGKAIEEYQKLTK